MGDPRPVQSSPWRYLSESKFFLVQVYLRPELRAVLLAPGPHQLRLHQDRTGEPIYNRREVGFRLCPLSKEEVCLSLVQLSQSSLSFSPGPLGEPRARRAGPAARRPHPAQQEEGRQGAHVRRGDIHRVLAAPADVPGLVRHSSAGQQVSTVQGCPTGFYTGNGSIIYAV